MPSTYSTNLALELIGTGDQAGTWGTTTNTNLGTLIEQAISGYVTQAITDGADTTITIPNGATGVARNMYIECTGALTANRNLIVPANKKLYFIFNNTTGGFAVTVKVSGLTGISVPNGKKMVLTSNGTDIVAAENYIADFGSNSATITTATGTTFSATTMGAQSTTTFLGTSANITTITGTTISATNMGAQATTQFQAASANITTITGTTIGSVTGTTGLRAASAQITTLTGVTTLSGTNFTATSLTLTNALGRAQGGTGLSTAPTNGQLLIGNTSTSAYTLSALTAGTGITITNGAGSITIAASSTGGAQDYIVQSYGIV